MKNNRRNSSRTPIQLPVKINDDDWIINTANISDTGAFLLIEDNQKNQLKIGQQLVLQVQNSPSEAPKTPVEVVRENKLGVGVKFIEA